MIKIYQMDVLKALKQMPDESVDMQITSPPFWGLRSYGKEVEVDWGDGYIGELGLEPIFDLYIKHLCDIFDEVKRVLKKDGTCWVNLGDTYGGSGCGKGDRRNNNKRPSQPMHYKDKPNPQLSCGIQPKCLCAIPERFMIEMINRGWILRNKIIWHKPNHMPTSVKDRFANSWEYLFLFSKSKKYYFDLDAVRETHKHGKGVKFNLRVRDVKRGFAEKSGQYKASEKEVEQYHGQSINYSPKGKNPDDVIRFSSKEGNRSIVYGTKWSPKNREYNLLGKQPDDFFEITTRGYPEAHFAVFPEALVERPIKTTRKNAIIMDIFAGSGTTLKVARDLHRDSIGIEIKKEYCDLIYKRLFGGNQPLINDFEIIK